MTKYIIETATTIREIDSPEFLKVYKAYLVARKVPYRELEFETGQDIGLRGKSGVMYSELSA